MASMSSHTWLAVAGNIAFMTKPAAEVLASNLNSLRSRKKDLGTQPKIANKARLGQRTVGRALKGEVSTTLGSVERLAHAFGLETWQLLHPELLSATQSD